MITPSTNTTKLAVFLSFSGEGGVEKMVSHLLAEFAMRGIDVDLLALSKKESDFSSLEAAGVRVIQLRRKQTLLAIPELIGYLRQQRPAALLVAKDRAIRSVVIAKLLSHSPVRLVGRLGTHLSTALNNRSTLARLWRILPMRPVYSHLDYVVAVSEGVAEDTRALTGLSSDRVGVIRNPTVTPTILQLAQEPPPHPWLEPGQPPCLLAAGRLTRQKDFPTLIRAFARLRNSDKPRLIIIGEGRLRPELLALSEQLGVSDRVTLPGFQKNPYSFMRHANLFVLSSAWEGSPNVLTEALALGIPVVATDCPSGPRETLQGGRFGPLVEVGDIKGLANAIDRVLAAPAEKSFLQSAVADYHVEKSADRYLHHLGFN